MKKAFISKKEMDWIAEAVLNKAEIPILWQGEINRIDVDYIIEFIYDLEIEWVNIDHLSKSDKVLAAISPKHKTIYMNESKRTLFTEIIGTMNFSKAHELGHWILHVTKQQDYEQMTFDEREIYICRGGANRPPEEIQADMFAASLLMPKNIISEAVNQIKKDRRVTYPDMYKMKDKFEVSISALTRRVSDLGLLFFEENQVYMCKEEVTGQMSLL